MDLVKTVSTESNESVRSRTRKRTPIDFEFGVILGEGSYSTVLMATEKLEGRKYAVKVLNKAHIVKENKIKYVTIEKDVLQQLDHTFIVKLFHTFQDDSSLYFVLEYCSNGDLLGLLKQKGRFSREVAQFYSAELLLGIQHIHSHNIVHRDLKPENILLDAGFHIKITDFGSAKIIDPLCSDKASFVGTAEYCSPELLNDQKSSKASDIWAFGCILFQMLVGM